MTYQNGILRIRRAVVKIILYGCLVFSGGIVFFIINASPVSEPGCDHQREPVAFPHEMHMANYDCLDCHHVYDDRNNNMLDAMELYSENPDIMCISCHTPDSRINFQMAFHRQCIGCHKKETISGQVSGPVMCGDCHLPDALMPENYEMIIGD